MMRCVAIIAGCLLTALGATGQDRWQFGMSLHPGISSVAAVAGQLLESRPQLSLELGGEVVYLPNEQFSFQTGISISRYRTAIRDYSPLFPSDVDNQSRPLPYRSYLTYENDFIFLQVPLAIRLHLIRKERSNFFISLRLQLYINMDESHATTLVESGGPPEPTRQFNAYGYSAMLMWGATIGYQRQLPGGQHLTLEPVWSRGASRLLSLIGPAFQEARLWNVGVRGVVHW